MSVINGKPFIGRTPRITIDQYRKLLSIKMMPGSKYGLYKALQFEFGVSQSTLSSAVRRGVKVYDHILSMEQPR